MFTVPGVGGMDTQTAVAVQSLIESQEPVTGEEEDVFQCGKCKKQFSSLMAFVNHKQTRCTGLRPIQPNLTTAVPSASVNNSRMAQLPQSSLPAYSTVPPSPLMTQNMVLTDDLMSFANVDQALGTSTLQLQGAGLQTASPFLPQVGSLSSRSPNSITIFSPANTTASLPSSGSAFTSTVTSNHIQIQPLPLAPVPAEKPLSHTVAIAKPSPTKAGRKSAQAQAGLITVITDTNDPNAVIKMRRTKNGSLVPEEKKKLNCQYCNKAFTKMFDLQQHIRAHTGEKPFQCVVCGRAFAQKSNVKKHMNTHKVWPTGTGNNLPEQPTPETAENPEPAQLKQEENIGTTSSEPQKKVKVVIDNSYVCQYCPAKFKSYFQLKTHMIVHKNEQVYKCSVKSCGATFKELDLFLDHIKVHENEMSYRCHMCNKNFPSLYELGLHQYTHSLYPQQGPKSGPRHYQCTKCMNKYSTPEALDHHLNTASHDHPCPHCNKSFTCERFLRRHLPSHGSEGQFECTECGKKFKVEHYLKMHMLIHTGETPFACDICGAAFNRKDKLKRHKLIHEKTKRYKCPFKNHTGCNKEFNRADKLKAHIISHSGVRPYKCKECGRCFSRKPHLIEHERGHRADFKFKCEVCQKGFFRPKLFKEHKCTPLKPGETRVYRRRGRRKVGRPRKKMITVEFKSTSKGETEKNKKEKGSDQERKEDDEEGVEDGAEVEQEDLNNEVIDLDESGEVKDTDIEEEEGVVTVEARINDIAMATGNSQNLSAQNSIGNIITCRNVMPTRTSKPEFCVKPSGSSNGLVNQGLPTHFLQSPGNTTNIQGIVTSHHYQPITIIEAQPINMSLPVHVASVDSVNVGDTLPLHMTSINGMSGSDTLSSHVANLGNVSVQELVPVQIMPVDDGETMETTHVVVTSSGAVEQSYVTSQLEDFGAVETDPVLQGTDTYLKAHAEILQSAQQ
ncbi:hypothetical protein FSP39_014292 [Pinctada imbricata]|uniref:C2H2-type domain-containing protein n=1 Tax=Pinctada imbricata TaxID=66713 RepID=A0AA89BST8_PINIB|nr:hypothetical protein FSP39_014292 [Pinctada imbricata]